MPLEGVEQSAFNLRHGFRVVKRSLRATEVAEFIMCLHLKV